MSDYSTNVRWQPSRFSCGRSDDDRIETWAAASLVTHLPELANVGAGSLLFGQFLSERPYSLGLALVGIAAWAVLIGVVFVLAAGERP